MERIRVAGLIPMKNGFAFMHRVGVQNHPIGDYYTFPGGRLEQGETLEEGTIREIEEEFGIKVKIIKKLYEIEKEEDNSKEYFFLCEHIEGELGTGTGPEFSGDPKYLHRGKYLPEIIAKEDIEDIILLPENVKEMLVKDIQKGRFN